jgi:thiamine pyrophosphate-dependent acetolactate synthase large subunit-like protein
VTSAKDLAPALEKALASMVPVLLDVVVGEEEYFAPDGTSRVRQGR